MATRLRLLHLIRLNRKKNGLSIVHTSKAKEAIKNAIRNESKDSMQQGIEILESKLKEMGLTSNAEILKLLLSAYEVTTKEELYAGIGHGIYNLENLKKIVTKTPSKNVIKYWELKLIGSKKDKKEAESTPVK